MYWNMKNRCSNPNVDSYENYGGRGIRVCREWSRSYEAFARWANSHGYDDEMSLDRKDSDGPYSPQNCRFIPLAHQVRNRRCTRRLTWAGKTQTPREWAEELGVSYEAFQLRITRRWTVEKIFTQPFRDPR